MQKGLGLPQRGLALIEGRFGVDRCKNYMAVSINCRSFIVAVLSIRAPLFGVYDGALDFLEAPICR